MDVAFAFAAAYLILSAAFTLGIGRKLHTKEPFDVFTD